MTRTFPNLSQSDFEALVRRAGLTLTRAQIEHLHEGWAYVEPMLERVRRAGRDRSAEPAVIYRVEDVA